MSFDRRNFAKKLGLGAMVALGADYSKAMDTCTRILTPEQPEGPFYPVSLPVDSDIDLTKLKESHLSAKGQIVVVKGVVQDENCKPIPGAIVEIWQACHTGKYNHPSDNSSNKLDPNFQYYGLAKTNEKGEYKFKTILPGAYNASSNWVRPPHIHYKVSLRGYKELITQLYFKGEKLNQHDKILQDLRPSEQSEVIVDFKKEIPQGLPVGVFNIKLEKL